MVKGTYTYTGVAVALKRGYVLTAVSGSYGINAQAVQLVRGIKMSMGVGTYTVAGQATNFVYSTAKTIFLASKPYTITGNDIAFRRTYVMPCQTGSYTISGQDAQFPYAQTQHYTVPYLIGSTEDAARVMIEAIHATVVVIGSGGTVVSQSPAFMQTILKGQTITITMGGVIEHTRRRHKHGLPPYTRGCN